MNKPMKTKIKSLIAALILILGGISYLLADRYLIQHVEVADVSAATVITSEANVATSNTSTSIDSETVVDSRLTTPSTDSTTTSDTYFCG